jgi:predicted dehydrogenase
MPGSADVTLAQLGCGYWGPNLLRNFVAQRDCRVKWVADASPARRAYVEVTYPHVRTIDDWQPVLDDPDVDAVIVATPASTHHEIVRAALEAGKDVFVEKPLAMSTRDADELVSLVGTTDRVLMAGHTFLYNDAVRRVKRYLDDGELGDVYYIYSQRLNLGQVRSDVNAWWNLAPHDVSILLYLMDGELPVSVAAHGVAFIQPGIHDVVFATLHWASGLAAHIQVSWLDPGKVRKMTLVGSRKMIVYDDIADDKLAIVDKGVDRVPHIGERMDYDAVPAVQLVHRQGDILLPRVPFREPLSVEAAHFVECLRTRAAPLSGPRHARDVVAVLEAGDISLQEGGRPMPVFEAVGSPR